MRTGAPPATVDGEEEALDRAIEAQIEAEEKLAAANPERLCTGWRNYGNFTTRCSPLTQWLYLISKFVQCFLIRMTKVDRKTDSPRNDGRCTGKDFELSDSKSYGVFFIMK